MTRRWAFGVPTRRRLLLGAAAALVLSTGAAIAGWFFLRPALLLDSAEQALRRHDPAAAVVQLDRYRALRPRDSRALLLAAQAARRSDACADAERLLGEYEQIAGPGPAAKLEWALLGTQQGDLADDEEWLRSSVARNTPDSLLILEALAKGYLAAYRWGDAIQALDTLLERSPKHGPGLVLHGAAMERLRRFDAAEGDLRRAVEGAPDDVLARTALAGLLGRLGHTAEAIAHFEQARRSRPTDPVLLLGLSRALADAAQLPEAERRLDELLAQQPDHADGLVERARLAVRQGRFQEAEPLLERAVRVAPWHRDGQSLLLVVRTELGRQTEAVASTARLAELTADDAVGGRLKLRTRDHPGDVAVRAELWRWSQRTGQTDEGVAWLTEILHVAPRDAAARAALADHFDRIGQPRRAAKHRANPPPRTTE